MSHIGSIFQSALDQVQSVVSDQLSDADITSDIDVDIDAPVSTPDADVVDTEPDAPIAPTSNPTTDDVVADAGPLTLPLTLQIQQIPQGLLIAGGVVTFILIVVALARAKARKRAAQVGAVAGFINRIRGK